MPGMEQQQASVTCLKCHERLEHCVCFNTVPRSNAPMPGPRRDPVLAAFSEPRRRLSCVVPCAACDATGLQQSARNDGSVLCRGCNGAGVQRV